MANFSTLLQPTTYCKKRPYFIIIYIRMCCCFVCTVIAYCCYFESGLSIYIYIVDNVFLLHTCYLFTVCGTLFIFALYMMLYNNTPQKSYCKCGL